MVGQLSSGRLIVLVVHIIIVAAMLAILIGAETFKRGNALLAWLILLVPLLVIGLTLVNIRRRERILGYWAFALLMVPIATIGMFGGWGILYLIGTLSLLVGAWIENEGKR